MSFISKGITLSYATSANGEYTALTNLQEIPELGGSKESIEVTTLADSAHTYTDGLFDYGDSIEFKFLYDTTQFLTLAGLTGVQYWKVGIPDGDDGVVQTNCTFSGSCSVKLDGVGTSAALTYTLSIKPNSTMNFA